MNVQHQLEDIVIEFTKTNITFVLEKCILPVLKARQHKESVVTTHFSQLIHTIEFWLRCEKS